MKILHVLGLLLSLSIGFEVYADNNVIKKIAFVDKDYVFSKALVVKNIMNDFDKKQEDLKKSLSAKKDKLEEVNNELKNEKGLLTDDAFEKKAVNFNKLVAEFQEEISNKKLELEKTYSNDLSKVLYKIKEIVTKLANKEKLSLVLFLSKDEQILYSSAEMDVSAKVIEVLDRELPYLSK